MRDFILDIFAISIYCAKSLIYRIFRMRLFYLISFVLAQDGIDYWDDSPGFLKRSHSLISPFSGNLPLWELKGDSMATSEYIRLTPDQQSKNGAIWSRVVSKVGCVFLID